MTIAEIMKKMITFSNGNIHDIMILTCAIKLTKLLGF